VFGFYPNKQITTAKAAPLSRANGLISPPGARARNQGRVYGDGNAEHGELGYNYRISEMNCALGNAQLKRIDSILLRREMCARVYVENLKGNRHIIAPPLNLYHRSIAGLLLSFA